MNKFNINLGERSYPIYITSDYSGIGKCIAGARLGGRLVLVTDTNVEKYQAAECIAALESSGYEVVKFVIPAGEKSKNINTVTDIYKFMIGQKLDRSSAVIALGGGVVGDITGFAAATFLRGINFVQVPTSSLAQADSSVGGKVGVDFEGSKNIVGAFYQPKLVYINVNALRTQPKKEFISGFAEIIKHGIIRDADFFEYINYNTEKIFSFNEDVLQYITKTNCSIKGSVVEQDEKESGLRAILNFGHTIGHAIESVYDFKYLHGECVSLGMVGAFKMAARLEMVREEVVRRVEDALVRIGLPVRLEGIDVQSVFEQMFYDKKIKNGRLQFVLPKGIGEVVQCAVDDEALIKSSISDLG
ncbi:3-dehydroquinate synthase [Anaerobacterium chartisolvens]|uniref:3-dehydroquinate synthase n=1 Tax=Anaerobacterium chartisolvens TaxID=1297424 RepID=A0A369B670_9FIRM|nr:3-dehydroquinate synthase [Anaerobacterium chartisolvens]RCX16825.1 3-dehydroquinate synthase [Anaerobacterium chartisolvens]